jgi:hypothetical protein
VIRLSERHREEQRKIQTGYTDMLTARQGAGKAICSVTRPRESHMQKEVIHYNLLVRIDSTVWKPLSRTGNLISSRR